MSANIILLDRELAHYGPEAKEVRDLLRRAVAGEIRWIAPESDTTVRAKLNENATRGEGLYDAVQKLSPKYDAQRTLQAQALTMAINVEQARWLLFEQSGGSISMPFLAVLVFGSAPSLPTSVSLRRSTQPSSSHCLSARYPSQARYSSSWIWTGPSKD
jgi:hypothetical protein